LLPGEGKRSLEWVGPVRFDMRLFSELLKRLAVAECVQWDSRKDGVEAKEPREPLSLADWYWLAREDTGSMFEICACLGARSQRFRKFGRLLGMLYHGCDDVADLFDERSEGDAGLSGGGDEDVDEGILTLPAALAIQDDRVRRQYREGDRNDPKIKAALLAAYKAQQNRAHVELDRLAAAAKEEAQVVSSAPDGLIRLVRYTRDLAPRPEGA
jgi:geranylgeranyl pyrophosphate synthase